jgi:small subunit ribosomal protein S17
MRKYKHEQIGMVAGVSGSKTVRVRVDHLVKHPRYGKYVSKRTLLLVHDPKGLTSIGDTVAIRPCRPVSKSKSWLVSRVISSQESGATSPTE